MFVSASDRVSLKKVLQGHGKILCPCKNEAQNSVRLFARWSF